MSDEMTFDEICKLRQEFMITGYIRLTISNAHIPLDVVSICIKYYGKIIERFRCYNRNDYKSSKDGMIVSKITNSHTNIAATLNGAIAGLVAITAEPLTPSMGQAIVIGAIGGIICMYGMKLLDFLKIDDVVMAIPAHLFAGIWGTLAVAWTNPDASLVTQFIGVIAYGLFTLIASFIVWTVIKIMIGIRATKEDEEYGLDMSELGSVSYPDFVKK